jgi:hypothetical protein
MKATCDEHEAAPEWRVDEVVYGDRTYAGSMYFDGPFI